MSVLDQAQNVRGVVSAARQRERWTQQMAKTSNEERREQLREAIADLEARFPEIEEIPPGGAEAFARERGHGRGARSPSHEGRRRPGAAKRAASAPAPAKQSSSPAKSSPRSPTAASPSRRRRRRAPAGRARHLAGLPSGETAWRQTGIPGGIGSGTSLAMSLLGATVGLSLLYLVLSSAERRGSGARALPELLGSITGFMQRFVSTRDILSQPRAAGAGGTATYTDRVLAGEVAGPPNLVGSLPQLPDLPRVRGQRVFPNPNLGAEVGRLPKVLPNR